VGSPFLRRGCPNFLNSSSRVCTPSAPNFFFFIPSSLFPIFTVMSVVHFHSFQPSVSPLPPFFGHQNTIDSKTAEQIKAEVLQSRVQLASNTQLGENESSDRPRHLPRSTTCPVKDVPLNGIDMDKPHLLTQASVPPGATVAGLGPLFMEVCLGSLYISWKVTTSSQSVASFDFRIKDLATGGLCERSLDANGLSGKAPEESLTKDGDWRALYMDPEVWKLEPAHSYEISVRGVTDCQETGGWVTAEFFFKGSRLWVVRSHRMKMKLVVSMVLGAVGLGGQGLGSKIHVIS